MVFPHRAQGEPTLTDAGAGETAADTAGVSSWVFDVDGCLVDSLSGTSLRPGARELLAHLKPGNRVFLWSAGGHEYRARPRRQFGVDDLVDGYFAKDGRDADGRYLTAQLPLSADTAVFVDDRPEDLADVLDVVPVSPYLVDDRFDRGLDTVWSAARSVAEPGRPAPGNSKTPPTA